MACRASGCPRRPASIATVQMGWASVNGARRETGAASSAWSSPSRKMKPRMPMDIMMPRSRSVGVFQNKGTKGDSEAQTTSAV